MTLWDANPGCMGKSGKGGNLQLFSEPQDRGSVLNLADWGGGMSACCTVARESNCFIVQALAVDDYRSVYVMHADSSISDIEEAFKTFTSRDDIAIILINQNVCYMHH